MEGLIKKRESKHKPQLLDIQQEYYNQHRASKLLLNTQNKQITKVKSAKELLLTSSQSDSVVFGNTEQQAIDKSVYSNASQTSRYLSKPIGKETERGFLPKLDQTEFFTSESQDEEQPALTKNYSDQAISITKQQRNHKIQELPNARQLKLEFIHKYQMQQLGIASKYMSDPEIKEIFENFYSCFVGFVKIFHQKAFQKLLAFIQFKNYLKTIFVSDDTSIVQLSKDIGFATLSNRFFNLKIYEDYLKERFTLSEIQLYKKLKKKLKNLSNLREVEMTRQEIDNQRIPSYSQFIRKTLLIDIKTLTQSLQELMMKKQSENLHQVCGEVQKTKAQIENLEIIMIKKSQNRGFNTDKIQIVKQFPINKIESLNGLSHISLLENVSRVDNCLYISVD